MTLGVLQPMAAARSRTAWRRVRERLDVLVLYFPLVSVPIALSYFLFKPGEWIWPNAIQYGWLIATGVTTQIG